MVVTNSINGSNLILNGNTISIGALTQGSLLFAATANGLTSLEKGNDNYVLTVNGNTLSWQASEVGTDNLGDHTASQNINLNGFSLVNGLNANFTSEVIANTFNGETAIINGTLTATTVNADNLNVAGSLTTATINGTTTVISQLFNGGKFNGDEANITNVNVASALTADTITATTSTQSTLFNGTTFNGTLQNGRCKRKRVKL